MKKNLSSLIRAIYAGFLIGIGGIVYLSCENKVAGAFLFSLGLFTICVYKLNLYTGKVGYFDPKTFKDSIIFILIVIFGNLIGTFLSASFLHLAGKTSLMAITYALVDTKVSFSPTNIIFSGFFCGILMHLAVNTFARYRDKETIIGYCAVFMCVMVFIISGFEHSIANMFYVFYGNAVSFATLKMIIFAIVGNALGATFIRNIVKNN